MKEFRKLFDGDDAQAIIVSESNRLREMSQTARYYRREARSDLLLAGGAAVVAAGVAAIGLPVFGGAALLLAAGVVGCSFTHAVLAANIESEADKIKAKIFDSNAGQTISTMGLPKPRA